MSLTILALDTATEACSVALRYQDQTFERYQIAPRQHTKLLLPFLQEILTEAEISLKQLDAIAFGCGPGSFTGLRVAASVVQGIAFAHDLPVLPISTLQAIAQGCYREFQLPRMLIALDAAMQEIYLGCYHVKDQVMVAQAPEIVTAPQLVSIPGADVWFGAGSGFDLYHEQLQQKLRLQLQQWFPHRYPRAYDIANLATIAYQQNKMVSAEQALPVYLRENFTKGKTNG